MDAMVSSVFFKPGELAPAPGSEDDVEEGGPAINDDQDYRFGERPLFQALGLSVPHGTMVDGNSQDNEK